MKQKKNEINLINNHPSQIISLLYLKKKAHEICHELKLNHVILEITLHNDAFIKKQNKRHRGINKVTDVLSFPQVDVPLKEVGQFSKLKGQFLGDILVSLDQAKRQSMAQKVALRREVLFLILHSLLHLCGFDHDTPEREEQMQKLESKIWKKVGVL